MKNSDCRHDQSIAETLETVLQKHKNENVSFGEIAEALHQRGFALLAMFVVLPNCVPVPVPPGISTIFSLPLLFLAVQMILGLDKPWLPAFLMRQTISHSFLVRILDKAKPGLEKLENNIKPRFRFLFMPYGERIIGVVWLIFALSIAVPLPFTNFLPGIGILASAFSFLRRDGLGLLIGFVIGTIGVFISLAILAFGASAIKKALMF